MRAGMSGHGGMSKILLSCFNFVFLVHLQRNQFLYLDKFQLEAVLENISLTSCTKQKILGKIETNYSSCLDYYMSLEFCDLPNVSVMSTY